MSQRKYIPARGSNLKYNRPDTKSILLSPLLFLIITDTGFGQDSIHVIRSYDNTGQLSALDSAYQLIPNTVFISFDQGFDDSVIVTINDKIIINEYLKTNESIDLAASAAVYFSNTSDIRIMKLRFVHANRFIQEKLNLSYKFLYVRKFNDWSLDYSNHTFMRE